MVFYKQVKLFAVKTATALAAFISADAALAQSGTITPGTPLGGTSGTVVPGTCVTGCTPPDIIDETPTTPTPPIKIINKPVNNVNTDITNTATNNNQVTVNPNISNSIGDIKGGSSSIVLQDGAIKGGDSTSSATGGSLYNSGNSSIAEGAVKTNVTVGPVNSDSKSAATIGDVGSNVNFGAGSLSPTAQISEGAVKNDVKVEGATIAEGAVKNDVKVEGATIAEGAVKNNVTTTAQNGDQVTTVGGNNSSYYNKTVMAANGGQAPTIINSANCFSSKSLGVGLRAATVSGGTSDYSKKCGQDQMETGVIITSINSEDPEKNSIGYLTAAHKSEAVNYGISAPSIADRFGRRAAPPVQAAPPATGVVIQGGAIAPGPVVQQAPKPPGQ